MSTKEEKIEKICSFYASEYHLEMIMIPYINRKIDEKIKTVIITEKSLKETLKEVISRVNLPEKRKEEILSINWENNKVDIINKMKENDKLSIFIVGSLNYIESINKKIEFLSTNATIKIINCYSIEEAQTRMAEIVSKHTKVLNTTEEKEIA